MKILSVFEFFLVTVVKIVVFLVRVLKWVTDLVAKVVNFLVVLFVLLGLFYLVKSLPSFWQSLVLMSLIWGGAISFICIVVLCLWKKDKFEKLFEKLR